MLIFDERHEVHVVFTSDDENALAGVTVGVRVFQDVEHVAALDVEDDVLETDAVLLPELRVLRVIPGLLSRLYAQKAHIGVGRSVPERL